MNTRTNNTAKRHRPKGFTLIEVLVVIFILTLLGALIVSVAGYVMNSASRRETAGIQAALLGAIQAYYDAGTPTKEYPPDRYEPSDPDPDPNSGRVLINFLTGKIDKDGNNKVDTDGDRTQTAPVLAARNPLLALPEGAWDGNWNSPVKDGWGNPMRYEATGGLGGKPVLISAGPDGDFGDDEETKQEDNIRSDEGQ